MEEQKKIRHAPVKPGSKVLCRIYEAPEPVPFGMNSPMGIIAAVQEKSGKCRLGIYQHTKGTYKKYRRPGERAARYFDDIEDAQLYPDSIAESENLKEKELFLI